MPDHPHVLVATLGGQPQIVTFTLDLLLQRGFPISDVFVIHPLTSSQPRLQHALACLQAEFCGNYYQATPWTIHFHSCVLELDNRPIDDISDDAHTDGTLNTIHQLIGDLKRQGYRIHLSISGGRRLMALLAISVASFNFDRHDHIWHLYTPESIKEQANEGAMMHVPSEAGVKLIQGPFVALGAHVYPLAQSFRNVEQEQRVRLESEERTRCAEVLRTATAAQVKVLRAFAKGLLPQEVANELSIALVTVNSHKTALLSLCHNAWDITNDKRLDYHFLHNHFADYFQNDG